jgi:hypothetical protein
MNTPQIANGQSLTMRAANERRKVKEIFGISIGSGIGPSDKKCRPEQE